MSKRSLGESLDPPSDISPSPQSSPLPMGSTSPPTHAKCVHIDTQDQRTEISEVMRCSLPPHRETLSFSSYEEYEVHYIQAHVNRCSECGKNFPTERFLSLHIEENHDPLIEGRRERGEKTYGCFVEGCERKCSTPQKRRLHLIDKHMFPRAYNFFIVNDGIDRHRSMLRSPPSHRRRVSTPNSPQQLGRLRRRKNSLPQLMNEDSKGSAAVSSPGEGGLTSTSTILQQPVSPPRKPANTTGEGGAPQRKPEHRNVETTQPAMVDEMADVEKSMAALKFIPTSVALRAKKTEKDGSIR